MNGETASKKPQALASCRIMRITKAGHREDVLLVYGEGYQGIRQILTVIL